MNVVEVERLSKSYGSLKAVDGLSFVADKGEILALVGPDGAGKTSTFRAICGLITYDSGSIHIGGHDVANKFGKIKPIMGYMPQSFSLYQDLSVEENLLFYAGLFGLSRKAIEEKKNVLYEFSGLGQFRSRRAGALSGGMKQKLALSCALVHDPQVLLLDEPTTGVDPLSRRQFWDILKSLRAGSSSIVISTPYMDEVGLADRAIFVYQGRKLAEGAPGELIGMFRGNVYRANLNPTPEMKTKLDSIGGLHWRRFGSSIHIYTSPDMTIDHYLVTLRDAGIEQSAITRIEPCLEDAFIQLMGR